ncbi:acyl-CoA synthetase [uncultured Pseudacidovorax sp.]|uniref:acyl-CoA synthetase n=1 Tax=uncultured Pseudacidovorax sp. TaxID=679313 RepID=UPI0025D43851|nr:acyl-CoA synthetase [uncultured Pseudacidovorax sp.]
MAAAAAPSAQAWPPRHPPLAAPFPVRSRADIERLAATPLAESLPARSTYELIRNAALAFGDKTALTFLRDGNPDTPPLRWTYAELLARMHQTANALHALGLGPTDTVAALLPGCLDYHLAHWGGQAACIVQPLNPLLTEDKLVALLQATGAKALIAYGAPEDADYWAKALRLQARLPGLRHVLRVAPHDEAPADAPALPPGALHFHEALAAQPGDRLLSGRAIAAGDVAACFHTGGTTGAPKLALHTHGNQVFTAWASVVTQGTNSADVGIAGFPLFHVAGVLPGALASLSAGAEIVIPTTLLMRNREVVRNYWKLVERYRPTVLAAVPTMLAALANVPLNGADISSITYCRTGAAPLPAELGARFERLFGLHVHESFGMTEMAGISSVTPRGVHAPAGCVGFVPPHAQVRIVALDAQGGASAREVAPGETGMVLFKSPNVFPGYLDPRDTAKAFTPDGWLATGDLGRLDEQGLLHLAGRAKDLIIRGGHNIDPGMLEDALGAHPAVQTCAAVGAPDAYAGELPVLFATLRPGAEATEAELLAFASARVDEPPARPKWVAVLPALPTTNVGKIYKPELRQMAAVAVVRQTVAGQGADVGSVRIEPEGATDMAVHLGAGWTDAAREALRAALAPLPVKVHLRDG